MTGTQMKEYPIKQMDAVLQALISAYDRNAWLTVGELAAIVDAKEPSVSAQIRNLRKPQNGSYIIKKRVRTHEGGRLQLWEFKIEEATVYPTLAKTIPVFKPDIVVFDHIREDGRVEKMCAHNIGHIVGHIDGRFYPAGDVLWTHGCDGCCKDYPKMVVATQKNLDVTP